MGGARRTYTHIRRCPDKRIGDTIDQLAADAEIAKLDGALGIHEDITRLDIAVDDTVFVIQVCQALEDGFSDAGKDTDGDGAVFFGDAFE